MRVNVYSQEITEEIQVVRKQGVGPDGRQEEFYGIRLYLLSSSKLHHTIHDDDRSAVTFWLPKSPYRMQLLANTLIGMGTMVQRILDAERGAYDMAPGQ